MSYMNKNNKQNVELAKQIATFFFFGNKRKNMKERIREDYGRRMS